LLKIPIAIILAVAGKQRSFRQTVQNFDVAECSSQKDDIAFSSGESYCRAEKPDMNQ
jgi:hypothetical protein